MIGCFINSRIKFFYKRKWGVIGDICEILFFKKVNLVIRIFDEKRIGFWDNAYVKFYDEDL